MRLKRKLNKGLYRHRNLYEHRLRKRNAKAISKRFVKISATSCWFAAVVSKLNDILREGLHLEPGGIVRENPPQLNINNEGEMVIAKDEAKRLADYINQGSPGITCAIKGVDLLKALDNVKTRLKLQVKI